jgi:D-aminopeptidase
VVRFRDLGFVPWRLPPGPHNALTDVPGVRVGHTTLIAGDGPLRPGHGPVRTGVTAIHPHAGSAFRRTVPAAVRILNGAGEITGRSQIDEYGVLESPILLTNTLSVGAAHRAVTEWLCAREAMADDFVIPVVAETYDGFLNDIQGQHVGAEHVFAALDGATAGPVAEGNVGGGTGMALYQWKGGVGTSSRGVVLGGVDHTVGVLVQANFGRRHLLRVGGVPVGERLTDLLPLRAAPAEPRREGSIVVVIGTDAPLSDRQLGRLCTRGAMGLARTGSIAAHGSGDLFLAFSNAEEGLVPRRGPYVGAPTVDPWLRAPRLHDGLIDGLFEAVIEAVEEAILNALVAAETMVGRDGNTLYACPVDRLAALLPRP